MSVQTDQQTDAGRSSGNISNNNKFLTFCLGEEEYGVEILCVREIIGITNITPLPQTPPHVKGIINLRGKIIPVIELRAKFGMDTLAFTDETCIIVVEVMQKGAEESFQTGVIVDSVREVMDIDSAQIEPSPRFGGNLNTEYIMGMGKAKDRVIILLDINRVLTLEEIGHLNEATAGLTPGNHLADNKETENSADSVAA